MQDKFMRHAFFVCLCLIAALLAGCGAPNTYVIFAQNFSDDEALNHAISIRLPLENQPAGAMISCEAGKIRVSAIRLDQSRVRIHDFDGKEWVYEAPDDALPVGLITKWPAGSAEKCGIDPLAPVGTQAYFLWGRRYVFLQRVALNQLRVRVDEDSADLSFPLAERDRAKLRKLSVPEQIVRIMY